MLVGETAQEVEDGERRQELPSGLHELHRAIGQNCHVYRSGLDPDECREWNNEDCSASSNRRLQFSGRHDSTQAQTPVHVCHFPHWDLLEALDSLPRSVEDCEDCDSFEFRNTIPNAVRVRRTYYDGRTPNG